MRVELSDDLVECSVDVLNAVDRAYADSEEKFTDDIEQVDLVVSFSEALPKDVFAYPDDALPITPEGLVIIEYFRMTSYGLYNHYWYAFTVRKADLNDL